jgi:CO/xanthine dehydrogenase FAD-binding subunit
LTRRNDGLNTIEGWSMPAAPEVLIPSSPDDAAALFGDGAGVTVVAGGTVVLPDITYGRRSPDRVLMLAGAGLDTQSVGGGTVTLGAALPVGELAGLSGTVPALAACALNLADYEIRSQGTVGGNLCVEPGLDAPRGDLQGPLLALGATVRSTGAGGERSEPVEDFLAHRDGRLVLDVSFAVPAASAFAALDYPHTHEYTVLAVTGVRTSDGAIRLAATGLAGTGARLRAAEAAAEDIEAAGTAAVGDVTLGDDALASAWYRAQTLPVLVRRVLGELTESA